MLLNEFLKEHRKVEKLEKQVEKLTAGLQKVSDPRDRETRAVRRGRRQVQRQAPQKLSAKPSLSVRRVRAPVASRERTVRRNFAATAQI
jgi:hypothetical protein